MFFLKILPLTTRFYNLWIKIDYKKIYADSRNPSRTQDMHPEGVSDNNFLIEPPR